LAPTGDLLGLFLRSGRPRGNSLIRMKIVESTGKRMIKHSTSTPPLVGRGGQTFRRKVTYVVIIIILSTLPNPILRASAWSGRWMLGKIWLRRSSRTPVVAEADPEVARQFQRHSARSVPGV
jgi:hypothetical protein